MRVIAHVWAMVLTLAWSLCAAAQPVIVASPDHDRSQTHVWLVARGSTPVLVFHIPPVLQGVAGGEVLTETGVPAIRLGYAPLRLAPDAVAAMDDRLFLFYETPEGKPVQNFEPAPAQPTRVVSVRAEWTGERWVTTPFMRPESEANLPAGREVVSAAGVAGDLFALLAPGGLSGAKVERYSLLGMDGNVWREVALPSDAGVNERAELFAFAGGVGVLTRGETGSALWLASVNKRVVGEDVVGPPAHLAAGAAKSQEREYVVTWRDVGLPEDWRDSAALHVAAGGGQLVLSKPSDVGLALRAAVLPANGKAVWRELSSLQNVGADPTVVVDGDRGAVMVISSRVLTAVEERHNEVPYQISVISLATGSLLAQGATSVVGPVEASDMTFIAVLMGWMVGLVALVVIRPPFEDGSWMLPGGVSLAEPMRRFLAWSIDLIIVVIAGGLIMGRAPVSTLTVSLGELISTTQGQAMVLAIVGVGVIGCSICEAAFGRTPGKFVANCQVVRLVRGANDVSELRNPSLAQALVRNLVKWIFPPAAFVIFRDGVQHRGEQYSKTAVTVPWIEELDEDEQE